MRLSDERLVDLLATVTKVGPQLIPPNTPCFWDTRDRVACTYDDLRDIIVELQSARTVVAQARNVSPRICGAAGVLDERVKAYDMVGASAAKPLRPKED